MSEPVIVHTEWCRDRTVRTSESIFNRTIVTSRCLGCGATITVPKVVTA